MKFQALRPATLLKGDSSKGVFMWILRGYRISANSCFWITLVLGAYSPLWSPFRRGGRVYKNYLRMAPEFFDELFVLLDVICTFN